MASTRAGPGSRSPHHTAAEQQAPHPAHHRQQRRGQPQPLLAWRFRAWAAMNSDAADGVAEENTSLAEEHVGASANTTATPIWFITGTADGAQHGPGQHMASPPPPPPTPRPGGGASRPPGSRWLDPGRGRRRRACSRLPAPTARGPHDQDQQEQQMEDGRPGHGRCQRSGGRADPRRGTPRAPGRRCPPRRPGPAQGSPPSR